jgi:pyruvate dehydrogenase E2 component (dihydrolipoamide acetyltransferase)
VVRLEEIYVPDLGDFKDVPVIEVLIREGQEIQDEEPLVTLESDKATMDVPSPMAGKVNDLLVAVGDKVSRGDLIVVLEVETTAADKSPAPIPKPADHGTQQQQLDLNHVAPAPAANVAVELAPAPEGTTETTSAPVSVAPPPPPATSLSPEAASEPIEVTVPDIGDFQDVDVIEVIVAPGDRIQAEDPLITLESDKATMDVPAPISGTVVALRVNKGDKVSEGSPILAVQPSAAVAAVPDAPAQAPPAPAPPAPVTPATPEGPPARPVPPPTLPEPVEKMGMTKPHASPSVRRFARELGVDLQRVPGTGRKGRIVKQDVQAFVKQALAQPSPPATATPSGLALPEMPQIDFAKFGEITVQPMGRIKRLTATSLHRSWVHVPHVTHHDEADITELEDFRKQAKEEAIQRGVRLTMLAFIMKACVSTLKQYPSFNASLEIGGENLILKQYYHLGIAVDTEEGLVVPVIREVDQKGVLDLAKELGEVSERARDKKLTPNDLQGGTFTISSLGGIGGTAFTPIVNAPEVAILGVSRAQMKPVYKDDDFIPRLMLPLSLSYDHRVIDGAEAARFTAFLTRVLEDARRLLL